VFELDGRRREKAARNALMVLHYVSEMVGCR
jgi:hypothetical protein